MCQHHHKPSFLMTFQRLLAQKQQAVGQSSGPSDNMEQIHRVLCAAASFGQACALQFAKQRPAAQFPWSLSRGKFGSGGRSISNCSGQPDFSLLLGAHFGLDQTSVSEVILICVLTKLDRTLGGTCTGWRWPLHSGWSVERESRWSSGLLSMYSYNGPGEREQRVYIFQEPSGKHSASIDSTHRNTLHLLRGPKWWSLGHQDQG